MTAHNASMEGRRSWSPRGLAKATSLSWARMAIWIAILVMACLIVYPLAVTLVRLIQEGSGIQADAASAGSLWKVLSNTAVVVLAGSALALVVGSMLAWLNERTDGHIPGFGNILPLAPLLLPPIAGVIGWAVLLDPRAGFLNGLLRTVLDAIGIPLASGPFNIYSMPGLIGVTALYLVPYVYLIVAAALSRLDPAIEEASRISRAGPLRTLIRITLPAVMPALAAAALLTIVVALGLFSVPIVLGTQAGIDVISVYIYRLLEIYPPKTAQALMLAGGLVMIVQVLLVVQRLLAPVGRNAAVGGRGFRAARVALGPWRYAARALAGLYLAATSILPLASLTLVSLQPFWTPDIRWDMLSLANYTTVLIDNGLTRRALFTSLGLGMAVATVCMVVVGFIMLQVHQDRGAGRRLIDAITGLPATIPHTVIGVGFLIAFSQPPLRLYGTVTILFLAYVVMALPFAARTASSAASSVGHELAEASRVFGASEGRTFRRVLFPLAMPGLVAGWIVVFIHTVGEVTASALLAGTSNPVIGRMLMELWTFGSFPQVAALALVMSVVNTILVAIMLWVTRRSFNLAVT